MTRRHPYTKINYRVDLRLAEAVESSGITFTGLDNDEEKTEEGSKIELSEERKILEDLVRNNVAKNLTIKGGASSPVEKCSTSKLYDVIYERYSVAKKRMRIYEDKQREISLAEEDKKVKELTRRREKIERKIVENRQYGLFD